MAVIRSLLAVTLALLLSGCAMYRLEDLRQTKPTGNAFQTALARMYMDLATQMEKGYDWVPSWHFAEKGLLLAYGHDVPPESLADWNITASDKPALSQARGELLVALTPANEAAQPEVAARAQVNFDCWVRYQDANWQIDRINECRENFKEAMAQLVAPPVSAPAPVEEKEVAPVKSKHHAHGSHLKKKKMGKAKPMTNEAAAPETVSYVIFFEPGSPAIANVSRGALADIEHSLANQTDYEVVIHGYGAEAGKNVDPLLADERIEAIKKRLVTKGVKAGAINAAGFGISQPKRPHEAIHQRIDIFINE